MSTGPNPMRGCRPGLDGRELPLGRERNGASKGRAALLPWRVLASGPSRGGTRAGCCAKGSLRDIPVVEQLASGARAAVSVKSPRRTALKSDTHKAEKQ